MRTPRPARALLVLAGLALAALATLATTACDDASPPDGRGPDRAAGRIPLPAPHTTRERGPEVTLADFVGAEACADCHRPQYDSWRASTHGRAGGPPSPEVVIAPFDGEPMRFADAAVFPERRGEDYAFRIRRPGEPDQYVPVTGVVGGGHMVGGGTQGFLTASPDGTVRFLPFDWSRDEGVWFCNTGSRADRGWVRIDPSLRLADCGDWPPSRVFGHTDRLANCQECHGSRITVATDEETGRYISSHADLRVDCESCHGPARAHVEAARSGTATAAGGSAAGSADALAIRSLRTLDTDASLQVCFRCHALKDVVEPGYLPGKPLEEHYALKFPILGDDPYFPDGRVRTFAYQANHLYSECYVAGSMTCTDCHSPHSNDYRDVRRRPLPDRFDDGQCLACHTSIADAPAEHTRHPVGADGGGDGVHCVACHMPYLQHPELGEDIPFARSDHVIAIPRPAFDDSLGLRSACAQCHTGRSAAELQAATEAWWGPLKPHHPLVDGLVRARRLMDADADDDRDALRVRAARLVLRPDLDHPIAQFAGLAHLLEAHMRPDIDLEDEIRDRLTALSASPDLDVRALALATLHYAAGEDPEVRRTLADALEPRGREAEAEAELEPLRRRWALVLGYLGDRDRDAGRVDAALVAYDRSLEVLPGDARTLSARALALQRAGRAEEAVEAFRSALELDPSVPLGRVNLGIALQQAGRVREALDVLREALRASPYEPLAYFSMGNLLLRAGQPDQAERFYQRAVELDPGLDRGWFYLARSRIEQRRYEEALPAARRALEFAPDDAGARQMVVDLERALGASGSSGSSF